MLQIIIVLIIVAAALGYTVVYGDTDSMFVHLPGRCTFRIQKGNQNDCEVTFKRIFLRNVKRIGGYIAFQLSRIIKVLLAHLYYSKFIFF